MEHGRRRQPASGIKRLGQTAVKKATSLSLTDFRFLLELYPKRRTAARMLRARDMVAFLRTGRAYVTTASVRLEEQGYLEKVESHQWGSPGPPGAGCTFCPQGPYSARRRG